MCAVLVHVGSPYVVFQALGKLREKHELELCTFQEQFAARESQRTPKLSRDLLNLRRIQVCKQIHIPHTSV